MTRAPGARRDSTQRASGSGFMIIPPPPVPRLGHRARHLPGVERSLGRRQGVLLGHREEPPRESLGGFRRRHALNPHEELGAVETIARDAAVFAPVGRRFPEHAFTEAPETLLWPIRQRLHAQLALEAPGPEHLSHHDEGSRGHASLPYTLAVFAAWARR